MTNQSPPNPSLAGERKVQGSLEHYGPSKLFHIIELAAKSGILHLYDDMPAMLEDRATARFVFDAGNLLFTEYKPESRNLITMLHRRGQLTAPQHTRMQSRFGNQCEKAQALGLIESHYITQQEILATLHQRAIDDLNTVLLWEHGLFSFQQTPDPARHPDWDGYIKLNLPLAGLLEAHRRYQQERHKLFDAVPDLDIVLHIPADAPDKLGHQPLDKLTWQVLAAIHAGKTIRQVGEAVKLSDLAMRRIVLDLQARGLLEMHTPASLSSNDSPNNSPNDKPDDRVVITEPGNLMDTLARRLRRMTTFFQNEDPGSGTIQHSIAR